MFEGVLKTPVLKNKVDVKCVNKTLSATTQNVNYGIIILKYFNYTSQRLTAQRKDWKFMN